MKLFDWLNNITLHKKDFGSFNSEEQKSYSIYQINRFISMVEIYIPAINQLNKYQNLTNEVHHNFLISLLPKRKQFFQYIKKEKGFDHDNKEICDSLMEYFECSKKEANLYLDLLGEEAITIKNFYKK